MATKLKLGRMEEHAYFMTLAAAAAMRSTCFRKAVGCVLVSEAKTVLATGYSGVASNLRHCNEEVLIDNPHFVTGQVSHPYACPGARDASYDPARCLAVHAEQNALLQCGDVGKVAKAYVTKMPCLTCIRMLGNTGCTAVHYYERYHFQEQAVLEEAARMGLRLINTSPASVLDYSGQ